MATTAPEIVVEESKPESVLPTTAPVAETTSTTEDVPMDDAAEKEKMLKAARQSMTIQIYPYLLILITIL